MLVKNLRETILILVHFAIGKYHDFLVPRSPWEFM